MVPGSQEWIGHYLHGLAAVFYQIAHQRHRLHCRMLRAPGWFVVVNNRGVALFTEDLLQELLHFVLGQFIDIEFVVYYGRQRPVWGEVVRGAWLPSVQAGFVFPLIILPPHHNRVFYPDQGLL